MKERAVSSLITDLSIGCQSQEEHPYFTDGETEA